MAIQELTLNTLDQITKSEFSVLLFYANGCAFCEAAKPYFEALAVEYPQIQFLKANFSDLKEHYEQFAEEIPSVKYEPMYENGEPKKHSDGAIMTLQVPELNEDGSPKMTKRYAFPSFYVYHTKASDELNPLGFIGGFDGANPEESRAVIAELASILPNE